MELGAQSVMSATDMLGHRNVRGLYAADSRPCLRGQRQDCVRKWSTTMPRLCPQMINGYAKTVTANGQRLRQHRVRVVNNYADIVSA